MANGFVLRKGLISLGGVRLPLIEINDANYSIDADTDYYIDVTASSSNRTMTLPTPVEGLNLIIKNNFNSSQLLMVKVQLLYLLMKVYKSLLMVLTG